MEIKSLKRQLFLIILFWALAIFFNAVMDVTQLYPDRMIFPQTVFWLGYSEPIMFPMFYDAWHLAKQLMLVCFGALIYFSNRISIKFNWLQVLFGSVFIAILTYVVHEVFFKFILVR